MQSILDAGATNSGPIRAGVEDAGGAAAPVYNVLILTLASLLSSPICQLQIGIT